MKDLLQLVLAAIVVIAGAGAADAQTVSPADAKCRSAFQKNLSKYNNTIHKTIAGCWKDVLKGKRVAASTDCNQIFGTGAADDPKGKVAKAKTKLVSSIGGDKSKCDDALHATALAEFAGGCPSPAAGPITTWSEARDCAIAITEFQAEQVWTHAFDPPVDDVATIAADRQLSKCAAGFHKAAIKLASTTGKERGKAQASSDKSAGTYDFTNGNADPKTKIAGSRQKLFDAIDKNCAPSGFALSTAKLAALNSCRTDIDGLKNCLAGPWERNGSGVTSMAYEQAGICPSAVTVEIDAGKGGGTRLNATRLDTGWTGLGHDVDVSDGFVGSIALTCDDGTCGSCTPTLNCDPAAGNCRCRNDVTAVCLNANDADSICAVGDTGGPAPVACSTDADCSYCTQSSGVNTVSGCTASPDCPENACSNAPADERTCTSNLDCHFCTGDEGVSCSTNGDCGSGLGTCSIGNCRDQCVVGGAGPICVDNVCAQSCDVNFGPPLPLNSSNTPVCAVNKILTELESVVPIDVGTGTSTTGVDSVSVVYTGISQEKPCPVCEGAPESGDVGTCDGGPRDGLVCTTNGTHAAFGATSYDCPPDVGANITGAGLQIHLEFSDAPEPLPQGTHCTFNSGNNPLSCACAVCTGGANIPCNGDTDCPGGETCTSKGPGNDTQPNACSNLTCDAGKCTAGVGDDIVRYCDNYLRGDGQGILICASNTDCTVVDPVCPGGNCGNCELVTTRSCFTSGLGGESIAVDGGQSGTDGAVLASGFCVPPTGSASVNSATGLPGPSRIISVFRFTGQCADGTTPWQFPGGSNCQ